MKKSITYLILFISFSGACYAQGSLQFNRVLTVSTATTTVPTGKVWKVTNYYQASITYLTSSANSETTCTNPGSRVHPVVINGKFYFLINNGLITTGLGTTIYYIPTFNELPLWLPENSTIATVCPDDFLSIIEFNIIP